MSHQQLYESSDATYGCDSFPTRERIKTSKQRRPQMGRRRGKTPTSFNGMHRRRRRKINW